MPRPLRPPVETWQPITSATQRGYDFMAQRGIKGVIAGGTAVGGRADKFATEYREALARVGRTTELGEDLAIAVQIHMADTQEKAMHEATPFYEEQLKVLAPLGRLPHITEEQVRATFDPLKAPLAGLPTIQDVVDEGTWICGPPEHVTERIMELQERFPGLERLSIGAGGLGIPPHVIRQDLEWFGTEVMPAVGQPASVGRDQPV